VLQTSTIPSGKNDPAFYPHASQTSQASQASVKPSRVQAGNLSVKPQHVRNHLWLFVNCLIENPASWRSDDLGKKEGEETAAL